MKTVIRDAATADVVSLIGLSTRTIRASYSSFLGEEAVEAYIASGAVDQYVADSVDCCCVILVHGEIAGYAVWRDNLVDLMMIDSNAHRRGLGSLLLRHVEAALFQRYEALSLESFEGNRVANAFYRKHGWRQVSRQFDEASGGFKLVFSKSAS